MNILNFLLFFVITTASASVTSSPYSKVYGELGGIICDGINNLHSVHEYTLQEKNGKLYHLNITNYSLDLPELADYIEVYGKIINSMIIVEKLDRVRNNRNKRNKRRKMSTTNPTIGVYLLNFQNKSSCGTVNVTETCASSMKVNDLIDIFYRQPQSNIRDFFLEVSNGKLDFKIDENSFIEVLLNRIPENLYNDLDNAIMEVGGHLNYNFTIFIIPNNFHRLPPFEKKNFAGVGQVRGSRSYVRTELPYSSVFAHELGHNLGWSHSNSYYPNGTTREYGDGSSIMGTGNNLKRGIGAIEKLLSNYGNVIDVSGPSEWVLTSLNQNGTILTIGQGYTLEYRERLSYDAGLSKSVRDTIPVGNLYDAILVKRARPISIFWISSFLEHIIPFRGVIQFNETLAISHIGQLGKVVIGDPIHSGCVESAHNIFIHTPFNYDSRILNTISLYDGTCGGRGGEDIISLNISKSGNYKFKISSDFQSLMYIRENSCRGNEIICFFNNTFNIYLNNSIKYYLFIDSISNRSLHKEFQLSIQEETLESKKLIVWLAPLIMVSSLLFIIFIGLLYACYRKCTNGRDGRDRKEKTNDIIQMDELVVENV